MGKKKKPTTRLYRSERTLKSLHTFPECLKAYIMRVKTIKT